VNRAFPALAERPRLAALLAAVSLSFSGIFYRLAHVSPETASFFRSVYGLPLLLAATIVERRVAGPLPRRQRFLAAAAGVFFAADLLLWHHSIDAVGAGLATVLGNLQVVVVALATWALFGERPPGRTLAALPIVLAGVGLIGGVLGGGTYGSDPPLGVSLGILTAISYAGYLILIRRISRRHTAEPIAISTASTAVVTGVVGLLVGRLDVVPSLPAHAWLILLGLTAQSAGGLLITLSLPRLPAVVTSIILLAQPVMSVVLAMLLLGEAPSPAQLLGVGLVLGGIAVATIPLPGSGRRVRQREPETRASAIGLDADPSTGLLDDLLDDGKADARSPGRPVP
jgi:drug/metabolite transporter (DMT)-like permease